MTLPTKTARAPEALGAQVRMRVSRRREQQIGDAIRHGPVQFLRHVPVATPQPGFDVRQPAAQAGRSCAVTSAQAIVEFTSPTTITQSGRMSRTTGSNRSITRAVCCVWLADPTSRLKSGAGMSRSSKNWPDIWTS